VKAAFSRRSARGQAAYSPLAKGRACRHKAAVSGRPDQKEAIAARPRKLLVLDTSYALEAVRQRGQEKPILCRDLDGFFDHVWSVHPFATLVTSDAWGPRFGRPATYQLAPRHTVIEGKVGRYAWLSKFGVLNFLGSQLDLLLVLRRLIREQGISAIRAPSPLYVGLFGLLLARLSRVPLAIRVGANHDELRKFTGSPMEPRLMRHPRIEKWVERFVLSRADLVAGANQNNLDFAIAAGARPERSTLFRYGNLIDPVHLTEPQSRASAEPLLRELGIVGERFIISIGRLEDTASVKHPEDVIHVLRYLKEEGSPIKAVIVGSGPTRGRIEALAKQLGLEAQLVMAGSRNQEWLARVLPRAAVHLCPHGGRALSEAALAAAPTVAYDIDWQRELVETGATGILVEYRDLTGLARGTQQLLDDPAKAAELGKALRKKALELLDPERLNDHEREEYRKLLTDHVARTRQPA
jgi:glycosyltransferase involved in cell wall biosynthesis